MSLLFDILNIASVLNPLLMVVFLATGSAAFIKSLIK